MCGPCWSTLSLIERPWCAVLGTPFECDMGDQAISLEAMANPKPFDRSRAAVAHDGVARRIVGDLKYRDRLDLARWMAQWMVRAGHELLEGTDAILPVPLHRRRFITRRYNQSAELARAVSSLSGIRFAPELVERRRATRAQVGLKAKARQENVRGAFHVPTKLKERVEGMRILLVDDVYTTGATVSAIAAVLKRKGASRVDVLTFSRVLPGRRGAGDAGLAEN